MMPIGSYAQQKTCVDKDTSSRGESSRQCLAPAGTAGLGISCVSLHAECQEKMACNIKHPHYFCCPYSSIDKVFF